MTIARATILLALVAAPQATAFAAAGVRPAGRLTKLSAPLVVQADCALSVSRPSVMQRSPAPAMGLFGLGWAEIGVIGVLALLFFGPEKLAPLAKDLGKSASGLKEVTDSFAQGMAEGETGISKDGGSEALKTAAPTEKETSA